ncbi:c-type cytochrome biogenesis protein CcmI [Ignatzschineria cameli]|uniref:C-type cytochrome biogenesis protein CcmI n=1 Tax=Ignatzschineria cameli TaxID=2182793 RepID=A0A2U2ARD6_9GAMM|nr:c-type cytochrome biogenesis protein CcmI [Ignatzschineria cameli]PWD83510.1 c-type cytochrome biogenesis protein CcmI [Ignatzschineria cameli]PWD86835.1 c-type cytochrome biogenesis protein CcmI [Ignatzschineria cameli]PWD91809.1 c-type cytochrome biogenesis protein CcmI [Ignatzschineria cameli]PWD93605.1 c-type cytochrome biogenesis protein CcmI [Ignatzschineria cameli]PWD94347.1 c-type cytochrome biogenesis protein CcmI [Ignatzschineria cameli]
MTALGITYTLLFILISLLFIGFALWGKSAGKYSRLKEVYRDKYIDETETLDDDLARGKIDKESYEATKIELAKDLLAVAHKDRPLTPALKGITFLFSGAIISFSALYFWVDGYSDDAKNLDTQRAAALPYVKEWLAATTIEDLQRESNLMDLNPPEPLQQNLLGTLAALNLMSSRDHHTDPKELNLLGKIYLNMDQLGLAEKSYLDLYRLDPSNDNTYYTLLNIQLAKNNYQLDNRLEALFDQFVLNNATNESLLLYYGTVLFENQKVDKAMHFFSILADLYPEDSENRQVILAMIETLTGSGANLPPAAANAVTLPVTITLSEAVVNDLPDEAVLFIYLRDQPVGPPLAAKRIPIAAIESFPLTITIGDQDLLIPGAASLATKYDLSASAKISLNGDPITSAGDIESTAVAVPDLNQGINLLLDHIVE